VGKREHPFCSTQAPTAETGAGIEGDRGRSICVFFSGKGEERLHWLVYCNRAVNVGGGEHGEWESGGCLIYRAKKCQTCCRREKCNSWERHATPFCSYSCFQCGERAVNQPLAFENRGCLEALPSCECGSERRQHRHPRSVREILSRAVPHLARTEVCGWKLDLVWACRRAGLSGRGSGSVWGRRVGWHLVVASFGA
jgi:hypothetical protein